jgi:hypothetical protein
VIVGQKVGGSGLLGDGRECGKCREEDDAVFMDTSGSGQYITIGKLREPCYLIRRRSSAKKVQSREEPCVARGNIIERAPRTRGSQNSRRIDN